MQPLARGHTVTRERERVGSQAWDSAWSTAPGPGSVLGSRGPAPGASADKPLLQFPLWAPLLTTASWGGGRMEPLPGLGTPGPSEWT